MYGANARFLGDPLDFLKDNLLQCYHNTGKQQADINRLLGNTLAVGQEFAPDVKFDLQRDPAGYYNVVLLERCSNIMVINPQSGFERPIIGNYIPYLGQKDDNPHSSHFGRINISKVKTDVVFTFSFTGCSLVITHNSVRGDYYVYHEPTSGKWTMPIDGRYPDDKIVGVLAPDYDDDHINGFACLTRIAPLRWRAYVQTVEMGKNYPSDLDTLEFRI